MGSLQFITPGGGGGGGTLARPITPGIVNADVDPAAGIVKSKLAALGLVDADVAAGAGIAQSKLAALALAALTNGAVSLSLVSGGGLAESGGTAATLSALNANITSSYISGDGLRGYVRITTGAAGPSGALFTINFPTKPSAPFLLLLPVAAGTYFGDAVATTVNPATTPGLSASTTNTITVSNGNNTLAATQSYGWMYFLIS